MNIYDRNTDLKFPIVVHNDQPSEYESLVAEYKARGGRVQVIPEGVTTMPPAPLDEADTKFKGDDWAEGLNVLFGGRGTVGGLLVSEKNKHGGFKDV